MANYLTIATDEHNDLFIDGINNLAMREGKEAIANIVLNRQRTVTGELQYDIDAGIPYFATVFADPPDLRMFEAFVIADTEATPGVNRVESFSAQTQGETVDFAMKISTDMGVITVNG